MWWKVNHDPTFSVPALWTWFSFRTPLLWPCLQRGSEQHDAATIVLHCGWIVSSALCFVFSNCRMVFFSFKCYLADSKGDAICLSYGVVSSCSTVSVLTEVTSWWITAWSYCPGRFSQLCIEFLREIVEFLLTSLTRVLPAQQAKFPASENWFEIFHKFEAFWKTINIKMPDLSWTNLCSHKLCSSASTVYALCMVCLW